MTGGLLRMINNPTPEAKLKETPCTKVLNTKVTLHLHHTKKLT